MPLGRHRSVCCVLDSRRAAVPSSSDPGLAGEGVSPRTTSPRLKVEETTTDKNNEPENTADDVCPSPRTPAPPTSVSYSIYRGRGGVGTGVWFVVPTQSPVVGGGWWRVGGGGQTRRAEPSRRNGPLCRDGLRTYCVFRREGFGASHGPDEPEDTRGCPGPDREGTRHPSPSDPHWSVPVPKPSPTIKRRPSDGTA